MLLLLLQSKYKHTNNYNKIQKFLRFGGKNRRETADEMANKGEDSNTTTDDNISLNEVNWLNLDLLFRFVTFRKRNNKIIIVTPEKKKRTQTEIAEIYRS